MNFGYRTDIWHPGILHAPAAHAFTPGALRTASVTWLPPQPEYCFLADPFGLWHAGQLHVLAEHYDYRDKHGVIHYFTYDPDFRLIASGEALSTPHHLSYPFLIEDGADVYMLPEAHQSGALALYRATAFPSAWEKVCDLMTGPIVDASVVKHNSRWWMFYALEGPD
ncbi:MAG: hypothetical protein JNK21_04035, partial [Rhodospirillaceae bacterium]|nr:hypothetical protein [Rhodospirillaceae bacterium]